MKSSLLFLEILRNYFIVLARIIKFIINLKFKPKIVYFEYDKERVFKNSFLIIQLKLDGVIFLKLNNSKIILNRNFLVIDISKVDKFPLNLKLYGVFKNIDLPITTTSILTMKSSSFDSHFRRSFSFKKIYQFDTKFELNADYSTKKGVFRIPQLILNNNQILLKKSSLKIFKV